MVLNVAATFVNLPGDVISVRTITCMDKIDIILLLLLHHAHGDFFEVTDLFICQVGRTPVESSCVQLERNTLQFLTQS